jgi:SET domain-containing protein
MDRPRPSCFAASPIAPMSRRPPLFEIRSSPIQGRGAFALRRVRKGTRLIEYVGERIGPEEAAERYDDDGTAHPHVVLFIVDDDTLIDAAVGGNEARFFNHSCEPNCEAVTEDGHIFLQALRTIAPGEELTYDYQLEREGRFDPAWAALYVCRCGAATCRGTMLRPRKPSRRKASPGR